MRSVANFTEQQQNIRPLSSKEIIDTLLDPIGRLPENIAMAGVQGKIGTNMRVVVSGDLEDWTRNIKITQRNHCFSA